MAQPPQKPSRPAAPSKSQGPTKRPVRPDKPGGAVAANQQKMRDKARQSNDAEDDEEEYDEEEGVMGEWLRQSPSWLASMVFHMILLLVLALWTLPLDGDDKEKPITFNPPEIVDDEELEEEDDADLEEDITATEVVEEVVSPQDFEVESPEVEIDNDNTEQELAAAEIEFNDFATEAATSGLSDTIGGFSASGLGGSRTRGRAGAAGRGGSKGSEDAVEAALRWLADHQNRNGSWSWNHTAGDKCSGYANPGDKKSKMGATGIALMPFLGAGYTHQDGKYKETVRKGVKYLVGNMIVANNAGRLFEADGAGHEHMYCHGLAACALADAYGKTNDHSLQAPAQLALNYIVQAQHPENGGWLYTPRAGGDTSVVGWQVMALKSGILSHLNVPGKVKPLANKWLDIVQSGVPENAYDIGGFYGYRKPGDRPNASATSAIGILCRNYLGARKDDPGLRSGVEAIGAKGPHKGDMYYNYYASQVMYQNDGPKGKLWTKWNNVMRDQLVNTQVKNGKDRGSWYFTSGGHGSKAGGRVYCTSMAAMTLEVYYRYMPIYQQKNVEKDDFPLE